MWIIFKSLYWICYNITSVLCFGVFWPCSMWDLSSPTRDGNHTPCFGRWSLNHWTTREVPKYSFKEEKGPHYSVQLCPTLCHPMNRSTLGLPIHHQLPVSTQTHVCWVGDAIQPSHPLSSPSPPTLNLCQHPGLFKWVSSLHHVAKVLVFQLQHQSLQWTPRTDLL